MTEEKIFFKDLIQLGNFLKKERRLKGDKIEFIAKNLVIKKKILQSFENGTISIDEFNSDAYLKGFIKSYIKYLKIDEVCNLDLLNQKKISNLRKSNLQLETSASKKNAYGSVIILISLVLLGLVYLFWNKQTYINLYLLGTAIN
jgi:cytoskeletal protein RodZ